MAKLTDEWLIRTVALAVMSGLAFLKGRHSAVLDGNQASVTSYAAELHKECNTVAGPMPGGNVGTWKSEMQDARSKTCTIERPETCSSFAKNDDDLPDVERNFVGSPSLNRLMR